MDTGGSQCLRILLCIFLVYVVMSVLLCYWPLVNTFFDSWYVFANQLFSTLQFWWEKMILLSFLQMKFPWIFSQNMWKKTGDFNSQGLLYCEEILFIFVLLYIHEGQKWNIRIYELCGLIWLLWQFKSRWTLNTVVQ